MPDLPSGTVTFLFTDIEGSTKLLAEFGQEAFADALTEHRRAVRAAIDEHDGVELGTEGDSFFVVFRTADGALAAAQEAQDALAAGAIKVRMGLHTGTPLIAEEGYVGMDVHRAARVAASAHGGQVVVTEATRALAGPGFDFLDLGRHRLKDLGPPERLYQLGRDRFPALRSLERTNLPTQPTPFLGRERELGEVTSLLRSGDTRLLTLTGPGGSGKTRMALQAAAECAGAFQHGVFWVSIAGLRDPALVLETAAQALGTDDLEEYARDRELLIVLDNFEQVLDAATAVAELLAVSPQLRVLVTSREPLHVTAELTYPVPPLARDESITFFMARARAANPAFVDDDSVAEICRRLDDLPLALELAAARVTALSAGQLLERLESRLPLLISSSRDAPERQRTLRGAIAWSHDLLQPDEQRLFSALGVFAGGWTADAAERVCSADLDLLQSLVEKSLLVFELGRFSMLETIREFAIDQLSASGLETEARRAHALEYAQLAERWKPAFITAERPIALNALEADHDNLREALRFLVGAEPARALKLVGNLWSFWLARGYLSEGRRWLTDAIQAAPEVSNATRARALVGGGILAHYQGDYDEAEEQCTQGLALFRQAGDEEGAAVALMGLALTARTRGDYETAAERYQEAIDFFRRVGDTSDLAYTLDRFGISCWFQGDNRRARELIDESLALFQDLGDADGIALALLDLGLVALSERDPQLARPQLEESLTLSTNVGDRRTIAKTLYALGDADSATGDASGALAHYSQCLDVSTEIGDRWITVLCVERIAGVAAKVQPETAAWLFGGAHRLRRDLGASMGAYFRGLYECDLAELREVLDKGAFESAWRQGMRASPHDIVPRARAYAALNESL
jgi:predicted ATPase/class 3 adenylate cyclase